MARRRREALPEGPDEGGIPDRLLRFHGKDWARPDDPIAQFLDDAFMRAHHRYREAREAWAEANGGRSQGLAMLAAERADRWPVVDRCGA